jgi:hypothetical protein
MTVNLESNLRQVWAAQLMAMFILEQPEQLAANHRAGHADQEVRPAA